MGNFRAPIRLEDALSTAAEQTSRLFDCLQKLSGIERDRMGNVERVLSVRDFGGDSSSAFVP